MGSWRRGLVLLLCLPVIAVPGRVAAAEGLGAQAESSPAPVQKDPVLALRPAAKPEIQNGRIKLEVVVSGKQGAPIFGLDIKDFTVLDNKQPQRILGFHAVSGSDLTPETPVEVILVVDVANGTFQQAAFARQQAAKFLTQNGGHLAYPTTIAVFSSEGLRIQPRPSNDGNALAAVLGQADASIQTVGSAAGSYGELERFQLSVRTLTAIAENEAKKPGMKMLNWIGPGWPMLVGSNFASSAQDRQRIFDVIVELSTRLREAHIALYSISPRDTTRGGGPSMPLQYGMPSTPMASSEAPPAPRVVGSGSGALGESNYKEFLRAVKTARQADSRSPDIGG